MAISSLIRTSNRIRKPTASSISLTTVSSSSSTGTPSIKDHTAASALIAIASAALPNTSSIKDPTAGSTSPTLPLGFRECPSNRSSTGSSISPTTVSSSSSSNSKAYLLSLPRELLWIILENLIEYQGDINVCEENAYESIEKDNAFDALSKVCKTLRHEIESWFCYKRSSPLVRLEEWKIFPTKTVFVMPLDDVLYGHRQIASKHFKALQLFLIRTVYQTLVRHLVIMSRVLEKRTCPYILLNALWPCLKGMKELETVDLLLGRAGIWHNICKDSWLIPELEKGPKIQYLTFWGWKPPNGQNACKGSNKSREKHWQETMEESKVIKAMKLVGSRDETMKQKCPLNLSGSLAELKMRINELRWNQSPLLGFLRD